MGLTGSKTAGLAIALLLAESAFALGLGEASGRAVLGQPLRLEIPIVGGDGGASAKSCFRLRAPRAEVGNDFAARNARIDIVGAKLVVTTTTAVTEPVIGFAVEASCAGLARDYVLLVGLPSAPPVAPVVETPRAAAPAEPVQAAKAPAEKTALPDNVMRIGTPVTLEALAQQKYPLQPKAREKFIRMMVAANAGLTSGDAPIAAGTELRVPPGLPQRRVGPYLGETKAAPPQKHAAAETTAAAAPAKTAASAKASKDRLVLGAAAESNESKLLAEAERLANILVEQNKTQEDMTANLAKIEADYSDLRKQFVEMQTRLARIEAERAAEKQAAADSRTSQLIELLVAVLGGGAVGGIGLHLFQRRRAQRKADAEIDVLADDPPAPVAGAPIGQPWSKVPAVPPWIAKNAPANEAAAVAPSADATVSAAAMIAAVAGAAAARPPLKETNEAPAPIQARTGDSDLMAPQIVGRNPPPPPDESSPAAEAPALPEVQVETPEPPVVLEPLDFSPVAVKEEPPVPPAKQEAATQEALTLDFPEIKIPAAEESNALDFNKP